MPPYRRSRWRCLSYAGISLLFTANVAVISIPPTLRAANLQPNDGPSGDQFGWSVGLSGSIGLVGAFNDDIGANGDQGSAYVFRSLDTAIGTITQNVKLTASDGAANDNFGNAVSLSGNIGLVGAYGDTV